MPVLENQDNVTTNNNVTETTNTAPAFDPIAAINDVKANMVNKEDYNKAIEERDKYLKALIDGTTEPVKEKEEPIDLVAFGQQVFGGVDNYKTSVAFVSDMLKLRNKTIEQEGWDPGAGPSPNDKHARYIPSEDDYNNSQAVADLIEKALDECQGSDKVFASVFSNGLLGR
nr:MAG TPA: hypothetical protein [Herelleviridae sp.]